jgi:hypothetical protein
VIFDMFVSKDIAALAEATAKPPNGNVKPTVIFAPASAIDWPTAAIRLLENAAASPTALNAPLARRIFD